MKKITHNKQREWLNTLRFANRSGSHINCFRGTYYEGKSDAHEDTKYEVYKQLRKWGHDVIVEAIFNNGSRCDVLDLTQGIIYEVTFSETTKMLSEKIKKYPGIFEVRQIDATKEFNEKMLL